MAKNAKLKSEKSIEKFGIRDKLSFDEKSGIISLAGGDKTGKFYEQTLKDADIGITLDQVKRLQEHDAELLAATTLAGGELAAEKFKENPELKEISMSYMHGQTTSHAYFEREGTTPVRNVVEVKALDGGELKKVQSHIKTLFDDISN